MPLVCPQSIPPASCSSDVAHEFNSLNATPLNATQAVIKQLCFPTQTDVLRDQRKKEKKKTETKNSFEY